MTSATTPSSGARSSAFSDPDGAISTPALADRLNARLDAAVSLNVRVRGRLVGSWRAFSLAALGVATVVWLLRGLQEDVPALALLVVPIVPAAILSAHRAWVIRSGRPARLVFHRHVIANAAVAVPLLALLDALTWRAIDAATTAVLMGLAVGRLGCLRSGCCVGRLSRIGPRYPWLGMAEPSADPAARPGGLRAAGDRICHLRRGRSACRHGDCGRRGRLPRGSGAARRVARRAGPDRPAHQAQLMAVLVAIIVGAWALVSLGR
jgi:hypothetical protein